VSLRQDLIAVLAEELEADCNPVVALDTVIDYLSDERIELCYQLDLGYATVEGLINALRMQENQP
jgi:hypothetical protein